jgi:hypothetical protein
MTVPNKFTIDYKKWRCGGFQKRDHNKVGRGLTQLLNIYGQMCCLGQVSEQCGVPLKQLEHISSPDGLTFESRTLLPFLVSRNYAGDSRTDLSAKAMRINDEMFTTIRAKIKSLTKLFKEHNIELEFINVPKRHK